MRECCHNGSIWISAKKNELEHQDIRIPSLHLYPATVVLITKADDLSCMIIALIFTTSFYKSWQNIPSLFTVMSNIKFLCFL